MFHVARSHRDRVLRYVMNRDPRKPAKIDPRDQLAAGSVPTFTCIVYVSPSAGNVRARVANLPGLECQAATEREALGKIVPLFKQRIRELTENKTPIPWIEPPSPIEPGEQKRFIPVHL